MRGVTTDLQENRLKETQINREIDMHRKKYAEEKARAIHKKGYEK